MVDRVRTLRPKRTELGGAKVLAIEVARTPLIEELAGRSIVDLKNGRNN